MQDRLFSHGKQVEQLIDQTVNVGRKYLYWHQVHILCTKVIYIVCFMYSIKFPKTTEKKLN